jgi:arylsulfatase A-like enzyme
MPLDFRVLPCFLTFGFRKTKTMKTRLIQTSFLVPIAALMGSSTYITEKERPNILFIAVDDLRPELGCYGNKYVVSPNIDRLARSGMVFNNAYCQSAVCNPSRASLMTGLRPDSLKVWDLKTDMRSVAPTVMTLPQYLMRQGYFTTAVGKIYHNIFPDSLSWSEPEMHLKGFPFDPDAVYFSDENLAQIEKRKRQIITNGNEKKFIDRLGEWYVKAKATESADVPDNAYYDGAQTDYAIDKLKELKNGKKPFFLAVGYYRPHLPFNAPKKYWDLYDRSKIPLATNPHLPINMPSMAISNNQEVKGYFDCRNLPTALSGAFSEDTARLMKHGYYASVSYMDAQVGRLLDALEKEGLTKNTIIVLWGDHGWKLGEHRSWAKMTNFEIDTRAPLIISLPGMKAKGKSTHKLVEFVDIYPSLCELAGLPVPTGLAGKSTVPLLNNPEAAWKPAAYSQYLREGGWRGPDGITYMGYTVRTEQFRYVEWYNWDTHELAAKELYDHRTDHEENSNIAADPAFTGQVSELAGQLRKGFKLK